MHVDLSYSSPFRYGDIVVVKTHVSKVTPVGTQYTCKMYLKGEDTETAKPHFAAVTSHCVCDKETFKPVSQKKLFPELFEGHINASAIRNNQHMNETLPTD